MSLVAVGAILAALAAPLLEMKPLPPIHSAEASWYYDGRSTACGFHSYFGVANRTLPCGTKVTFYYGHDRAVKAMVDDRGPFIYSRLWDLNQNVRSALGCPDICYLKYRIGWR